ncbi:hypothetical protein B0920_02045 [Massilia sp. KIM]|uniref:hypothetical protein n=1 Tax=Massilia sp. KIM TaxID=1955422 RepID=UPI0009D1AADC|nr:hypothetical protein [Massilia sp. KIM]OON62282.1 hypothetical protein B0920_02045 [Massilia sp. KIM]
MFQISAVNQTYFTPIKVLVPNGDGTGTEYKFKAQFKRLPQEELDDLYRRLNPEKLNEGEEPLTDDEVLDRVMVGWADVLDKDGEPLEFNEQNLAIVKNISPTRAVLVVSFFDSMKTAKRKN